MIAIIQVNNSNIVKIFGELYREFSFLSMLNSIINDKIASIVFDTI